MDDRPRGAYGTLSAIHARTLGASKVTTVVALRIRADRILTERESASTLLLTIPIPCSWVDLPLSVWQVVRVKGVVPGWREKMATMMDPGFALFNCHVNNAKARAYAMFRDMGMSRTERELREYEEAEGGVMAFGDPSAPPATKIFIGLVTAFVNENRSPVADDA